MQQQEYFDEYDVNDFQTNYKNIQEIASQLKVQKDIPSIKDVHRAQLECLEFINERKRKVYGGYALDLHLRYNEKYQNNGKPIHEPLYGPYDIADIDFYSPNPVVDLVEMCNMLDKKGFEFIFGREARHEETFVIYYYQHTIINISYVPSNIYNTIPFDTLIVKEDLFKTKMRKPQTITVQPRFMLIDYFRLFIDPYESYWRIDKAFKRFTLVNKLSGFIVPKVPLKLSQYVINDKNVYNVTDKLFHDEKFIQNMVLIGFKAYNTFLEYSNVNHKFIKPLNDIPYYDIISLDYQGVDQIVDYFKKNLGEEDIESFEYYPYWNFITNYTCIYYKKQLLLRIFNHNDRGIPFKPAQIKFGNKSVNVQLGSLQTTILFFMMVEQINRTYDINVKNDIEKFAVQHLVEIRAKYFDKYNKSIFDNTIFQDFVVQTVGKTIFTDYQRVHRIMQRKEQGKRIVIQYDPKNPNLNPQSVNFKNSSGKLIMNPSYLKLKNVDNHSLIQQEQSLKKDKDSETEGLNIDDIPEKNIQNFDIGWLFD